MIKGVIAGNFDVLHPGYIQMFKEMRTKCDCLVVLLHTDPSIERPHKLKPILSADERKELLLSNAEMNLSTELVHYEKQIEEYRASLLIYAYQQELINQNFDSTVSFNDIHDYYQLYKNEFILAKNIFKGRFIIIDKSAPNLKYLNNTYKTSNESTIIELEDYCQQFAKEYYTNVESWNFFSFINNKLPSLINDEESFLINTDGVFFEDELYRYYIYIEEFITKGNVSPLEVETDKIRGFLLNKKKVMYLKQLEDDLYQIALAKKKINIY